MIGRHHLLLGTAAAALTTVYLDILPWQQPGIFALALLTGGTAALLPDIDTPQNELRRKLGLRGRRRLTALPRWLLNQVLDLIAALLPHRGPTHWLLTALLLAGLLRQLVDIPWLWPVFLTGYLSHLLADSLTSSGVPLLAPMQRRSLRLLPRRFCVRTGSLAEGLLVRALLLLAAGWYVSQLGWLASFAPVLARIGW